MLVNCVRRPFLQEDSLLLFGTGKCLGSPARSVISGTLARISSGLAMARGECYQEAREGFCPALQSLGLHNEHNPVLRTPDLDLGRSEGMTTGSGDLD